MQKSINMVLLFSLWWSRACQISYISAHLFCCLVNNFRQLWSCLSCAFLMAPRPADHMDIRSWKINGQSRGKREADCKGSARPKSRIRRSMTACNTCRKLKTRCDLDPRNHACRRCLSLRYESEFPSQDRAV